MFERKRLKDEFIIPAYDSLARLKAGEGYKLELKSQELLTLGLGVKKLYALHRQEGVPRGRHRFLRIEAGLSHLLDLTTADQRELLALHPTEVANALSVLLKWVSESPEALSQFSALSESEFPSITSVLGLSSIKSALNFWKENQDNDEEEFWQTALKERAFVLSQAFAYPVVVIQDKVFVGGTQYDRTHAKVADFLMAAESTGGVLLIELKTPNTSLLTKQPYRPGVYPFSADVTAAIAQVVNYQKHLSMSFNDIFADSFLRPTLGQPRCLVIVGNASRELTDQHQKESFELQRERLQGVSVITYDELFNKLSGFVNLVDTLEADDPLAGL